MRATNAASRGGHRALAIPQSFLRTPSDANPACDISVHLMVVFGFMHKDFFESAGGASTGQRSLAGVFIRFRILIEQTHRKLGVNTVLSTLTDLRGIMGVRGFMRVNEGAGLAHAHLLAMGKGKPSCVRNSTMLSFGLSVSERSGGEGVGEPRRAALFLTPTAR